MIFYTRASWGGTEPHWQYRRTAHSICFFQPTAETTPASFDLLRAAMPVFVGLLRQQDRDDTHPLPVLARAVEFDDGSAQGWLLSSTLSFPGGPRHRHADAVHVFIPDIFASEPELRVVNVPARFDRCIETFKLLACPCELARTDVYWFEEDPAAYEEVRSRLGNGSGVITACAHRNLVPATNLTNPQLIRGLRTRVHFDPVEYQKKHRPEGFTYLAPKFLTGKPFEATYPALSELSYDPAAIAEVREQLSNASKDAAVTRNFRRTECGPCVFSCSDASRSCNGAKDIHKVTAYIDQHLADDVDQFRANLSGFMPEHQAWLISQRYALRCYTGKVGAISSYRRLEVALGYFTDSGAFRVFANRGDTSRCQDFWSWGELVSCLPELEDICFEHLPEITDDVWRVLTVVASTKWKSVKSGWGHERTADLRNVHLSCNTVYVDYNRGPAYALRLGDDFGLYNFARGHDKGYFLD